MKNINIFAFVAVFGALILSAVCPGAASAAKNSNRHDIRIESEKTAIDSGSGQVRTELIISLNNVNIPKRSQLRITPYLQNGQNVKMMPAIAVNGSIRNRLIARERELSGERDDARVIGVAKGRKYNKRTDYAAAYPLENWMNGSLPMLLVEEAGCGGKVYTVSDNQMGRNVMLLETPVPVSYLADIVFIEPEREIVKNRDESGEANIIYLVGRSDIRPELGNNHFELDKIFRSIALVRSEPTARISKITIRSYASPEGTWESNLRLSERRAESLAKWVQNNSDMFRVRVLHMGLGEDWEGLERLAMEDPILDESDKMYIRDLNRYVGIFEGRESRLMEYRGGYLYRYLLGNIFPELRRSHYKIEYTVPEFTFERSKELYDSRPGLLSLAELSNIANQHEPGSPEFREAWERAAKLFPNDKIANLNAAAAQLAAGYTAAAKGVLEKYKDEPQAWINLGNLAAIEGDLDLAESYFERARSANMPGAGKYLEDLSAYRTAKLKYDRDRKLWDQYGSDK